MSRIIADGAVGISLSVADSEIKFGLGEQHTADSGVYLYAQADGAIAEGALVKISDVGQADSVTTAESAATPKKLGVCVAAGGLADNQYGWFWRGNGVEEALLANGVAADTALTTTATAGVLGTGGDAVVSLVSVDANSSGAAALGTVQAYGLLGSN